MPIDIRGLAPLLGVFDMQRSVRFYRDVLGFELVSTSAPGNDFGWALLRRGGAELMLNILHGDGESPSTPDPARIAAHRDTALFFGCPDLDAAYAHLRAHGVDAEEPFVQGYGMKQLYLRDPDGYTLCFQWPASQETADQWREWYGLEVEEAEETGQTVEMEDRVSPAGIVPSG
ncbi:MAG TPA: VOC family protein [Longimicrobium sp.]|nr:VOC family protein [Longimicrobium sp.]